MSHPFWIKFLVKEPQYPPLDSGLGGKMLCFRKVFNDMKKYVKNYIVFQNLKVKKLSHKAFVMVSRGTPKYFVNFLMPLLRQNGYVFQNLSSCFKGNVLFWFLVEHHHDIYVWAILVIKQAQTQAILGTILCSPISRGDHNQDIYRE